LSFSCCAGDRCDITGSDKDCDRSRRPDAEDRGWSNTSRVHGDQMIERLGDAVCGLHRDKEMSILRFLIWPQNQGCHFLPVWLQNWWLQVSQVGSQIGSYNLVIWVSKSLRQFLGLWLKTKWNTVFWLRYKTDGRMKTTLDTHRDLAVCFMWK
jgi:hypothetical protein